MKAKESSDAGRNAYLSLKSYGMVCGCSHDAHPPLKAASTTLQQLASQESKEEPVVH
jgi:hypothetical protein